MSTHIDAPEGAIAKAVLLPGDPLRAQFIAEHFLQGATRYNDVRGMFGYTGTYKGARVSVQGTGMGQPSLSIYANELFRFYGVEVAIRVGTCGATRRELALRDVLLAQAACSDSALNTGRFGHMHYAPIADFGLLECAWKKAGERGLNAKVGLCVSSDNFYDDKQNWRLWSQYGVLGVEMEAAELYTLAASYGRRALAILTVSDHILLGTQTTAEERQTSFTDMISLALDVAAEQA